MTTQDIKKSVRERYGAVAASGAGSDPEGARRIASAFGYSASDLQAIPAEANLGLSCGNPTALAGLRPGEVVIDLGSGAGIDVFLASPRVGPTGRIIGIDMSPEMVDRARATAQASGYSNVEFHLGDIETLPLPGAIADCVISNCVINLAPDKRRVFAEIARVLKPGGRLAASDIALRRPLPPALAESVGAYTGCIAGAITIEDYERGLREAGFTDVQVVDTGADLSVYSEVGGQSCCNAPAAAPAKASTSCCGGSSGAGSACCAPAGAGTVVHDDLARLMQEHDINEYAASVKVYALKRRV